MNASEAHREAIAAWRAFEKRHVPDLGPANPLIQLAHDSLLLYSARMQKGLPPKGNELPTAVRALGALCEIRKRADTDTNITEKSMIDLSKLDKLEKEVDEMLAKLKHKSDEDGDGYEDVSNPAADASANSDSGDDDDTEENDDELDKVLKASVNAYVRTNDETNRPGKLKTSDHDNFKGKVEAMTANIAATENCSKTEALRRLRDRYPDVVAGNPVTKGAPAATFEDHVAAEMKKGVTREVAGQRVMQMFGNTLPHRITKADAAAFELEGLADDTWRSDGSLTRTEALRKTRLENPSLFRKMQR
jgi:hypothetical protein